MLVISACGGKEAPPAGDGDGMHAMDDPTVEITTGDGYTVVTTTYLSGPDARVEAGPVGAPQGLLDICDGIGPWGPIVATHDVSINGETYFIKRLSSPDPFTATYQLEDGTIRVSNGPVQLVADPDWYSTPPPVITWVDPGQGTEDIYQGWILAWFKPEATEQEISSFIATHNLQVVMSWFEPPDTPVDPNTGITLGNAISWFQFEYDQAEFVTMDAALAYFNSHSLVECAMPDLVHAYIGDYAPPNDTYYQDDEIDEQGRITKANFFAGFVTALGVDDCSDIAYGPFSSGEFSNQVVAVIDDGVWRDHPDLGGL